jgi:hypothetical protein
MLLVLLLLLLLDKPLLWPQHLFLRPMRQQNALVLLTLLLLPLPHRCRLRRRLCCPAVARPRLHRSNRRLGLLAGAVHQAACFINRLSVRGRRGLLAVGLL